MINIMLILPGIDIIRYQISIKKLKVTLQKFLRTQLYFIIVQYPTHLPLNIIQIFKTTALL